MEFYKIKNEIKHLSMIDDRYKFTVDNRNSHIAVSLYTLSNNNYIMKSEILMIDDKRFEFSKDFRMIENKTIKSLLLNLACRIAERRSYVS